VSFQTGSQGSHHNRKAFVFPEDFILSWRFGYFLRVMVVTGSGILIYRMIESGKIRKFKEVTVETIPVWRFFYTVAGPYFQFLICF